MSKILIITGIVMMTVGFSRIAHAETTYTLKENISVKKDQTASELGLCRIHHGSSAEDLKKGTQFTAASEIEVFNIMIMDLTQDLISSVGGDSKLVTKLKTLQEVKNEAVLLGGQTHLSDTQLLEGNRRFKRMSKDLIEEFGGKYDENKITTLKALNKELLDLGASLNMSAEEILNNYHITYQRLVNSETKKEISLECQGIDVKSRLGEVSPFTIQTDSK